MLMQPFKDHLEPPLLFTSVHLFKKILGSRFTISSPRFQNNRVKIHRRKKWDRSSEIFAMAKIHLIAEKKWPHI